MTMPTTRDRLALARLFLPLVVLAGLVVVWHVVVTVFRVPSIVLPSPAHVATSIVAQRAALLEGAVATGGRVLLGFAVSVLVAVPLAILVVQWPVLGRAVQPLITLSQAVPKVALAPLVVVWLGNGLVSQTAFAALVAFFPVFIETVVGLRAIAPEMLLLARSMGSTAFQTFRKFRFPHALPHVFAGLKVGATLAVIGAIVAEWIGGETGVALVLLRADALLDTPLAVSALIVLAVMGMGFFMAITALEIAVMPWRSGGGHDDIAKTM
jgi:NitT/TauT family transport system permease protein